MTAGNFVKKGILPLAALLALTWLGQYIFIVDGQVDWLRACLVYGVPFGIPYMFFVVPLRSNAGDMAASLVLCIIAGAAFGCVIAVAAAIRSAYFVIGYPVSRVVRRIGIMFLLAV